MKKIIVFASLLILNCSNNEIKQNIETALKKAYSETPKLTIQVNLDSLKSLHNSSQTIGFEGSYMEKYNRKHNEWRLIFYSGADTFRPPKEYASSNNYRWVIFSKTSPFGVYSLVNMHKRNQIGHSLYGKNKEAINEINIVLNIYTFYKKQDALSKLAEHVKQISDTLIIEFPDDLYEKINKGAMYYFENDLYYIMLEKTKKREEGNVRYESFKFIIKSK